MPIYEATVLSSRVDGIKPSLVLTCGSSSSISKGKYVFNLPESLDRLAGDHKVPLNDVTAIFAPEVSTDALGGLGSRMFKSATHQGLQIVSPVGLDGWMKAVGLIARRANLTNRQPDHYSINANGMASCYKDSFIKVAAVHEFDEEVKLPSWLGPDCNPECTIKVDTAKIAAKCTTIAERGQQSVLPEGGENPEAISISFSSSHNSEEGSKGHNEGSSCVESSKRNQAIVPEATASAIEIPQVKSGETIARHTEIGAQNPGRVTAGEIPSKDDTNIGEEDVLDLLHSSLMKCISIRCRANLRRNQRTAKNKRKRCEEPSKASTRQKISLKEHEAVVPNEGKSNCKRSDLGSVDLTEEFSWDGRKNFQEVGVKRKIKDIGCRTGDEGETSLVGMSRVIWSPSKVNKVHPLSFPELSCPNRSKTSKGASKETPITLEDGVKDCKIEEMILVDGHTGDQAGKSLFEGQNQISLLSDSDCEMIDEINRDKGQDLKVQDCLGRNMNSALHENNLGSDEVVLIEQKESQVQSQKSNQGIASSQGGGESVQTRVTVLGARPLHHPLSNPEVVNLSTSSDTGGNMVEDTEEQQISVDIVAIQTPKTVKEGEPSAATRSVLADGTVNSKQSMTDLAPEGMQSCGATLLGPSAGAHVQRVYTEHQNFKSTSHSGGSALAFVINMLATDRLMVILFVKENAVVQHLMAHPVMKAVEKQKERVDACFHFVEPQVARSTIYREWMANLPGKQLVVKTDHGLKEGLDIGLRHMLDRGVRLNLVAPGVFPLPESMLDSQTELPLQLPKNAELAWMMTSVICDGLKSKPRVLPSVQKPVQLDSFWRELLSLNQKLQEEVQALQEIGLLHWKDFDKFYSGFLLNPAAAHTLLMDPNASYQVNLQAAKQYARLLALSPCPPSLPRMLQTRSETGVFFFGTGCSEPSSWRGGSAILLKVEEAGMSLMIDAGEGTYGQMIRYFGEVEAQKMIDSLGCIWVSHQHGDHCLGLSAIIRNRSPHVNSVLVIAPAQVIEHLTLADESFKLNAILLDTKYQNNNGSKSYFENRIGFKSFMSISVDHSCEAYGLVIEHLQGWKLVFSGDTRPCRNLRQFGKGCTLLIHEATHAPKESLEAKARKHSTWREALNEGRQMYAYRTILTHFSRRYPNLPTDLTPDVLGHDASIAFDGMAVPFAILPFLPKYNAAVHEALREIEEGDEEENETSGVSGI